MKLRPHHLLDIVTYIGHGRSFEPHPFGAAVPQVAGSIRADVDQQVQFVIGPDDICQPCERLRDDGRCDRVLDVFDPPRGMSEYNDELDGRLMALLGMAEGETISAREFLEKVNQEVSAVASIYTSGHPGQRAKGNWRLDGLTRGLGKLGVLTDVRAPSDAKGAKR